MTKLNGLLAILLLLHGAVSLDHRSQIFLPPDDEFATLSIEEFIERWNDRRRVLAIEDYIADMNMLSYATFIENDIKNMTYDCSNIKTERGYRWFQTGGNEAARKWESDLFDHYRRYNFRKEDKMKFISKTALFGEALNPMVSLIGCAAYPCTYIHENGGIPLVRQYSTLCVVASAFHETLMNKKFGWPGTICYNKRKSIAGLCKEPVTKKQASQ